MTAPSAPTSLVDLPHRIPVFPLSGALLLPRRRLPLNIFEPRYLDMVADALDGDRIIGMIQPMQSEAETENPDIYDVGGAGWISSSEKTEDGRYLISLQGVSRFHVLRELDRDAAYRKCLVDFTRYRDDLKHEAGAAIDRPRLVAALRAFLDKADLSADWKAIDNTSDRPLVDMLSMVCPFHTNEKQALLEAGDVAERARVMTALMEMALLDSDDDGAPAMQ